MRGGGGSPKPTREPPPLCPPRTRARAFSAEIFMQDEPGGYAEIETWAIRPFPVFAARSPGPQRRHGKGTARGHEKSPPGRYRNGGETGKVGFLCPHAKG